MILTKKVIESPLGPLLAYASDRGVRALIFSDSDPARSGVSSEIMDAPEHPVLCELANQLEQYFRGSRRTFEIALDAIGTEFQQQAWRALREIPFGETRSYGEQARAIGKPDAARAVGAANGRNPLTIVVPCHRVIGASGKLTGFAGGLHRKRALLEHEGVLRPVSDLPFNE